MDNGLCVFVLNKHVPDSDVYIFSLLCTCNIFFTLFIQAEVSFN